MTTRSNRMKFRLKRNVIMQILIPAAVMVFALIPSGTNIGEFSRVEF